MKDNANVNVDGRVTTQNVDQLTYGNSVQNGSVNPDGTFSFTHDMNDSANDSLGVLGTGTLNGKVNFTSAANGDGSTTVTLNSLDMPTQVTVPTLVLTKILTTTFIPMVKESIQ